MQEWLKAVRDALNTDMLMGGILCFFFSKLHSVVLTWNGHKTLNLRQIREIMVVVSSPIEAPLYFIQHIVSEMTALSFT